MEQIRVGFLGTRGHTLKFINLVNSFPEAVSTAIWSDDRTKAEQTAEEGKIICAETPEEVLDRADAVVITAPNVYKKELVIKAVNAGKHIFLEKPLAVSRADAKEMADAVRKAGVKFYMSDPFVRSGTIGLRNLIRDGVLGEVYGADVRIAVDRAVTPGHPPVWNKETALGGIMADIGGHGIHVIHYLFGMPVSVTAALQHITDGAKASGMEDQAQVIMQYADGNTAVLSASWCSGGDSAHTIVYGTKGWARTERVKDNSETEKLFVYTKDGVKELSGDKLPAKPLRHIRYFIEMIVRDLPNDIIGKDDLSNSGVSIGSAEEYAAILEAVYESDRTGKKIIL
ncbi:MAG: Gfo/Idh/MocA family oxidoreductase [Solobacterium sp.]|nr:Gfo/Idh/MocA family oxidoreductase [Solobacterium sp.]